MFETDEEFYINLLKRLEQHFIDKEMALVHCKNNDGEEFIALAHVSINPVSENLNITPFAKFWHKNPLASTELDEYPILAIQRPLKTWVVDTKNITCDPLLLN